MWKKENQNQNQFKRKLTIWLKSRLKNKLKKSLKNRSKNNKMIFSQELRKKLNLLLINMSQQNNLLARQHYKQCFQRNQHKNNLNNLKTYNFKWFLIPTRMFLKNNQKDLKRKWLLIQINKDNIHNIRIIMDQLLIFKWIERVNKWKNNQV